MSKKIKREIKLCGRTLSLETGTLAPQAGRAVIASYGDTVVLITVTSDKPREDLDYFPLRVDYEEKLYAGGVIKGSRWVKREGRPSDSAIISARLIDHCVRPLFPKDFMNEVQIVATILSVDEENDPEVLALVGASAALHSSNIPWEGPVGTVRVNLKDGKLLLNAKLSEQEGSDLDLVISRVEDRIQAIEGEGREVPEDKFLEAVDFGFKEAKKIINLVEDFGKDVGSEKMTYESMALNTEIISDVKGFSYEKVGKLIGTAPDKIDWMDAYNNIEEEVWAEFEGKYTKSDMSRALRETEKDIVRNLVLEKGKRADGRKLDELRPIDIEVGVLPRVHGSGLFSRGLTQSLTIATLGSPSLEQTIESMYGEETKRYIHHYNGPPYSLGEVGRMGGAGRREIGHGSLAEKALVPVLPNKEEFPYTIRVVSEIMSQNGSSSMAATCGSTLALMDAGVPIKNPVAGVAVGLITNEEMKKYVILTDIAGVEDFNGFLDFKLTGTRTGMTAVQMDIKLPGLPPSIFKQVVERSKKARLKVLDSMDEVISKPRVSISKYAPTIITLNILPKYIGTIIGPGGKVIRALQEETNTVINVDDDGTVSIAAKDKEQGRIAKEQILSLTKEVEVNEEYEGTVKRITDFGAFVELLPGKEGMVHISELSREFIKDIRSVVSEGDKMKVKVIGIDRDGRIALSKKALEPSPPGGGPLRSDPERKHTFPYRGGQRPRRKGPGFRTPHYRKPAYKGPTR